MSEIDGVLAEIVKDQATYDLRNWRKAGITPEEIRTRLEHPELCVDKAVSEEHFPNISGSRIFGYLWKELQKCVPSCVDKVIEAVMSHRTEELRKWANYLKDDGDRHYKGSLEEDIARFLSALDGFRQNPKTAHNLLFVIEHLESYIHHAKEHEEWRKRTVEALGETFTYAEWFDPLIKKAEELLSSVNKPALIEMERRIREERSRTASTPKSKRQKKPKITTKPLGEILNQIPTSKPQVDTLNLVAQLEKETHGRTFDEVRQPDEGEQLLKKYGWTKVYDDHEPTLDDIALPKTPPSVSTPQPNTTPSSVRTLLEKGTFQTRPEAENFAKMLKGKTDIQPLYGDKAGWFAVYEEEGTQPKFTSEEASQVHDYFTLNLEDAKIDPTKYEEEFKKALDTSKTWQENLEIMDALIKRICEPHSPNEWTQEQIEEAKLVGINIVPEIQLSFRKIFKTGLPEYNEGDVVQTLLGDIGKIIKKEEGQKYTLPNFVYTVEKQDDTSILVHTTAIEGKENMVIVSCEICGKEFKTSAKDPLKICGDCAFKIGEAAEPIPEVDCELHVQGGTDPANAYEQMFFVEIVPKGLKFPEEFFIARGISTTKELERWMKEGLDCYSEEESIGMSGDEEWEKEMLAKLPAPFNKEGGSVYLKWKCPDDVSFDEAGKILWEFYQRTFTAEELEAKTVDVLKIIAAVKGVQRPDRKAELIANILSTSVLKEPEPKNEPEAKTEQKESGDPQPQPSQQPVQEGVPQGFYSNEYLIDINKGFQPACEEGKYPKSMKCWKEGCDKPLEVCGYPFYICDNKHAFNIVTGERWLWKGYDEEYHGLLNVLQGHLEPTYQKLFFPQSRAKSHTEADRDSTRLTSIGDTLYDLLNVQTPDPYHWGKDTHRHHAGLRFAINMMAQAIQKGKAAEFPTDRQHGEDETTEPDNIEQWDSWQERYSHDASKFRESYGDEAIMKMLTSIPEEETKRSASKPKQASLFDF